ncbi:MAG: hypothetical protein M3Q27_16895 [Actinomycetota bacterium]|nr:hypothetical protein [Actinomycetota bacterium]
MTVRAAVVLARPAVPPWSPGGTDPAEWAAALLEDTYEVCAGLDGVRTALAVAPGAPSDVVERVTWPGTLVVEARGTGEALDAMWDVGVDEAVVVAPDAPDLPQLLLGKLLRGLGSADVAVCPAAGGGLVGLGARLPCAPWLRGLVGPPMPSAEAEALSCPDPDAPDLLDRPEALARLRNAAPTRRALSVGPGWHRVRTPADLARLDPGLEGWEATRALTS